MSRPVNSWARHYQAVWHERAADRNLPSWLRVVALAYGSHDANGHAVFAPGDVAVVLGTPGKPLDKNNVQRAIRTAVKHEWLSPKSGSRCLVVPGHAISGGLGRPGAPCPVHDPKPKVGQKVTHLRAKGGSESDPSVGQILTPDEPLTSGNVTALYDSSLHLSDTTPEVAS